MSIKIICKSIKILSIISFVLLMSNHTLAWQTTKDPRNNPIRQGVHQKLSEYATLDSILRPWNSGDIIEWH